MARYKADTISQLIGQGYWVRVLCRCGNHNWLDPYKLIKSPRVGLKTTIEDLRGILKCKLCGQRPWDVFGSVRME